jgi:hypothetical protein
MAQVLSGVGLSGKLCACPVFFFRTQKKSLRHENSSTYFGRFSELYMEKLFDICSDSTPVEEGLTGVTVQGAFLALKMVKVEHEILFRFLHQLLKGKSRSPTLIKATRAKAQPMRRKNMGSGSKS